VLDVNQYAQLPGPSVVPIDVSWHMPGSKRDPLAEFESKRLPRARLLNLDKVANHEHPMKLPHMMPSANVFTRACSKNAFRDCRFVPS
jgi:thiosulfate/3-mercaptopyruvate sulfurtransferase